MMTAQPTAPSAPTHKGGQGAGQKGTAGRSPAQECLGETRGMSSAALESQGHKVTG